jgi:hypothetical protein
MAGQKFPEVGLRAVFELTGFQTGYRKYQTMMRDIDRTTQQTTKGVGQATKGLTGDVVRSFSEFARRSTIVQDAYDNLRPGAALAEMQRMSAAFLDLGRKAQVNVTVFDHLVNSGLDFGQAMQVAGGQIQFNLGAFDRLIQKGVDADQAFQLVTSGAADASKSVTVLGRSFSIMAVATGAAVAVLKIGIQVVRDSVESYEELAEATRQVHYQTGLLTQEASAWVNVSRAAGISTATSARAMTSFLGKVAELRREQLANVQSTSRFAWAMDFLKVEILDTNDQLKPTAQLLQEINEAVQALGPGYDTTAAATALFGYSGRFLLPILADQEQTLADMEAQAQSLGATLTSLDRENYEDLRKANIRLQQAFQGIKNEIARGWVPAITAAKNALADFLNFFRQIDARMRAFSATADAVRKGQVSLAEATKYYADQLQYFLGIENEAARAAEQGAQDRFAAAQKTASEIAAAEAKIRVEREKTLKQLDRIKTQLNQKLADIDRDAARQWADILVNRQREAMDRALQLAWRLDDLRSAYNDRLDAIERDFAKRWDDILVKRQRDAIERAMRLAWQYEDLARATAQRRADVLRDYAEREVEQRREVQRRIRDLERDAQQKREDLEREHQRRLRDIQQDFLDTAQEAARRNDAVAVARAMRARARAVRDEEQRYQDSQRDLAESLTRRREEIERDRQEREADQRRELERALRRIEENYQQQLRELARQQAREAILREQQYRWEREDFEKAKAEQLQAAQDAYDKQIEELEKAQKREAILRAIQYRRQAEDFNRNWRRRILDARRWYQLERDDLAAHLNYTAQQLEQAYVVWIQRAAAAAATAARTIAVAWASEISRYQHYLSTRTTGTGTGSVGGGRLYMAEGGVVEASSPTTIVMGEAGPETGVFLPGRASSLSVSHSFGKLGVDFQGLPAGMSTQQVQSIVYAVMTQLAKGIQIPR